MIGNISDSPAEAVTGAASRNSTCANDCRTCDTSGCAPGPTGAPARVGAAACIGAAGAGAGVGRGRSTSARAPWSSAGTSRFATSTGASGRVVNTASYNGEWNSTGCPDVSTTSTSRQSRPLRFSTTANPCRRPSPPPPSAGTVSRYDAFHTGAGTTYPSPTRRAPPSASTTCSVR